MTVFEGKYQFRHVDELSAHTVECTCINTRTSSALLSTIAGLPSTKEQLSAAEDASRAYGKNISKNAIVIKRCLMKKKEKDEKENPPKHNANSSSSSTQTINLGNNLPFQPPPPLPPPPPPPPQQQQQQPATQATEIISPLLCGPIMPYEPNSRTIQASSIGIEVPSALPNSEAECMSYSNNGPCLPFCDSNFSPVLNPLKEKPQGMLTYMSRPGLTDSDIFLVTPPPPFPLQLPSQNMDSLDQEYKTQDTFLK